MDCPKKETLFTYHNRELDQAGVVRISNHLEQCQRCRRVLSGIERNVALVNDSLDLLQPDRIPERTAISVTPRKAKSVRVSERTGLLISSWREGVGIVALAATLVVLLGGMLYLDRRQPDFSTAQAVAINEQQFMADAKEDLRERSIYLSVYNERTGRLEIIRSTAAQDTADIEIISLR